MHCRAIWMVFRPHVHVFTEVHMHACTQLPLCETSVRNLTKAMQLSNFFFVKKMLEDFNGLVTRLKCEM